MDICQDKVSRECPGSVSGTGSPSNSEDVSCENCDISTWDGMEMGKRGMCGYFYVMVYIDRYRVRLQAQSLD